MKETQDTEEQIEEFHKETSMLTKFQNEYLIHYYGSVNIPNKICMITEYASYHLQKKHIHTYYLLLLLTFHRLRKRKCNY